MARKQKRVDAWLDETVTAPRQFVPNPKENRRAKFVRGYVWFSTVALVPMLFLVMGVMINSATPIDENAGKSIEAFDSTPEGREGQAEARMTLANWLKSSPSPLPGATILGFDGSTPADPVAPAVVTASDGVEEEVQRDNLRVYRYSLSTKNGAVWLASVTVGFSDSGVQVASLPSVMPVVPSDGTDWAGQDWPGERTVQMN